MSDIITLLNTLAELQTHQEALRIAQEAAVPATIRRRLDALAARFAPQRESLAHQVALLEGDIKTAVLAHGASVKGRRLQAVFLAGRTSWDDHALQGYAAAGHEELLAFRTMGKPSVSLRPAKWATDAA
jgi:hypothetical protein